MGTQKPISASSVSVIQDKQNSGGLYSLRVEIHRLKDKQNSGGLYSLRVGDPPTKGQTEQWGTLLTEGGGYTDYRMNRTVGDFTH